MTCPADRHGTATAYQVDGCRCPAAREAQRVYRKRLRLRHYRQQPTYVPAEGVRRRIHALMALGWPRHEIFRRAGYADNGRWLDHPDVARVLAVTRDRINAVYDELSMTLGPSRWTATYARNRGWLPPLAWDDDRIDDPAYRPAVPERMDGAVVEEYEHLAGFGWSEAQIAARLGIEVASLRKALYRAGVAA